MKMKQPGIRGPPVLAQRAWYADGLIADQLGEPAAERPEAGVADEPAHLGHRQVGGPEQVLGPFDPPFGQVRRRRHPVRRTRSSAGSGTSTSPRPMPASSDRGLGIVAVDQVAGSAQVHQQVAGHRDAGGHGRVPAQQLVDLGQPRGDRGLGAMIGRPVVADVDQLIGQVLLGGDAVRMIMRVLIALAVPVSSWRRRSARPAGAPAPGRSCPRRHRPWPRRSP